MDPEELAANAACIQNEILWFRQVLEMRLRLHSGEEGAVEPMLAIEPPELPEDEVPYAEVVRDFEMGAAERLVLLLSYLPHIKPDVLDLLFIQNQALDRRFTEFGGITGASHGGFLPTAETALFLLAGENLLARLFYRFLFHPESYFFTCGILRLDHRHPEEPPLSSALQLTPEYVERLTTGSSYHPPFSPEFPAQRITTPYDWDELVLEPQTRYEVEDIVHWIRHRETLLDAWGLARRLKPGFRALFHGPPGTGKTLTASLLGKVTGVPVFRIDLSKVVSKWIGETEKNLASLFDHAEHRDWILFFDEADSLFGRRTESRDANDRAANQQVSYLLQRIEDFPGTVILASNLRSHLDEAFSRRFQAVIHFPVPGPEQRLRLWEEHFRDKAYSLAGDVDLRKLARDHELAGGGILNVLRYACLKAVVRETPEIRLHDLVEGIRRELHKEGRSLGPSR